MDPSSTLRELAKTFRVRVRPAARLALVGCLFASVVLAGLVARRGTGEARAGAALAIAVVLLGFLLHGVLERRSLRRRELVVRRLLLGQDRELGERVLRAIALEERAERDPSTGSLELARLHLARAVGRIPARVVEQRGTRVARRFRVSAFVAALLGGAAFGVEPPRVLEGLDVLAARNGIAPVDVVWLEALTVVVQPPAYLRSADTRVDPSRAEAAQGSVLVVRGIPVRSGRKLVLSDGRREVGFMADGSDGLVARWTLDRDVELRVAARFGDVLVREPLPVQVRSIADAVPEVELEGAPKEVKLEDLDRLELRYDVSDDHGLRQIDLVLRSGGREDRRVLEKLDGQARSEQGAQALDPSDAFLRRAFLPVEVRIEAKDNDVFAGDKWGRSAAITLVPPAIGAPEAARFRALLEARGKVVDFLAYLSEHETELTKEPARTEVATRRAAAAQALRETASGTFGGARVTGGLQGFLRGQAGRLEKPAAKKPLVEGVEDALLAVHSALRALGVRDAQSVAKRLGDAADEAADGYAKARVTENRRAGIERAHGALRVLDVGAENLAVLDVLGADLGSVTQGELRRIRRAEQAGSLLHAELAARHLAARLHRPTPSFGSAGGGGAGGVEAGEHSGSKDPSTPPSEADKRFDEMADELDSLMREHAALIEQVDGSLRDANEATKSEELRREAAERAEALRNALDGLPRSGAREGTGRAAAALAREHAGAMAERLERLEFGEASDSGRTARGLAEEAQRKALDPQTTSDLSDLPALDRARQEIEKQLAWAEQALEKMRRDAEQSARERLGEAADRERSIERRMGELAQRAEQSEAALPQESLERLGQARDVMKDAAGELGAGRGERGLELQREAQRLLEQGSAGRTTDSDGPESKGKSTGDEDSGGRGMAGKADVPGAPGKNAAADFRRRVLEGLGKERAGRLEPAIRRYAEGLLE
ncbi:MAG TPA: DUF4175 domain-containing protein [Polyangiaceae bacterium]